MHHRFRELESQLPSSTPAGPVQGFMLVPVAFVPCSVSLYQHAFEQACAELRAQVRERQHLPSLN